MPNNMRGMFLLDPPSGGLARLRHCIRVPDSERGWLSLLPWATAASLLIAVLTMVRLGQGGLAHRIEEHVLGQEPVPWTQLPQGQGGSRLYLARPLE